MNVREILEALLALCLSLEVWVSVIVSLGLLLTVAGALLITGRLYRRRFVRLVRRLTGIQDSAGPRRVLERLLKKGQLEKGVLAECERAVATCIAQLYELSDPNLANTLAQGRDKAIARLDRASFPELILSRGERAAFFQLSGAARSNGRLVLALMLRRELNRIYSVDVALRAIRAAEWSVARDSKRRIDICRLRVGTSKNLARQVLRHILTTSSDRAIKPVAKAELAAIRESL